MPLYLLTGAGFSRNWGGWLANEAFEYLLGCDGLHPRARRLLWEHKDKGTGFEGVYQALKDEATNPTDNEVFKQFHDMVSGMFLVMRNGFLSTPIIPPVGRFLAAFDAIFTLNQDTLLELQYFKQDIRELSHGTFFGVEAPGLRNARDQEFMPPGFYTPRDGEFSVRERHQPYFKLHGSCNWAPPEGPGLMLILGGNKAVEINKQPLLSWYHFEFEKRIADSQVMIVGYSFGDEHINQILMKSAARGTRFFIVDTAGTDVIDKRLRKTDVPTPLMQAMMNSIDGASRRTLVNTIMEDHVENIKLYHFMSAHERKRS